MITKLNNDEKTIKQPIRKCAKYINRKKLTSSSSLKLNAEYRGERVTFSYSLSFVPYVYYCFFRNTYKVLLKVKENKLCFIFSHVVKYPIFFYKR